MCAICLLHSVFPINYISPSKSLCNIILLIINLPTKNTKLQYYNVIPSTCFYPIFYLNQREFYYHLWNHPCPYVEGTLSRLFAFPEDKLQSVEKQYLKDLQKENQKWSSRTEKHLLELHKQWEHKKKKLLNEEVIILCSNFRV